MRSSTSAFAFVAATVAADIPSGAKLASSASASFVSCSRSSVFRLPVSPSVLGAPVCNWLWSPVPSSGSIVVPGSLCGFAAAGSGRATTGLTTGPLGLGVGSSGLSPFWLCPPAPDIISNPPPITAPATAAVIVSSQMLPQLLVGS